jgi:hypothetical protein
VDNLKKCCSSDLLKTVCHDWLRMMDGAFLPDDYDVSDRNGSFSKTMTFNPFRAFIHTIEREILLFFAYWRREPSITSCSKNIIAHFQSRLEINHHTYTMSRSQSAQMF